MEKIYNHLKLHKLAQMSTFPYFVICLTTFGVTSFLHLASKTGMVIPIIWNFMIDFFRRSIIWKNWSDQKIGQKWSISENEKKKLYPLLSEIAYQIFYFEICPQIIK